MNTNKTRAEITELDDDIVFPTITPTNGLGVPVEEEVVVPVVNTALDLEDIDDATASKNKKLEEAEETVEVVGKQDNLNPDIEKQIGIADNGKVDSQSDMLRQTLKNLYGESFTIVQEIEGEEDVEVSIDDIDLDPETFAQIVRSKEEAEKQEMLKDTFSTKGVSEFTKSLAEIESKGGSVAHLLQYKEAYLDPLATIDIDTESGQESVLSLYFQAQGRPDDEASILIAGFKSSGLLEEKALQAKEQIDKSIEKKFEEQKLALDLQEKQRQENLKSYRTDLTKKFGEKFELNETAKKKLLKFATEQDDKRLTPAAKAFKEKMSDPDTAAELILYLMDSEEFLKQKTKEKVLESKISLANKIRIKQSNTEMNVKRIKSENEEVVVPNILKNN
jgi:hypothetical protein